MKKGSEFTGVSILNINCELLNYYVCDLIYCTKKLKVLGFLVQKHLKSKEKKVVLYRKIKEINDNGIVVSSSKDILLPKQLPEIESALNSTSKIIGFEIYGINGDLVGIVKDTVIDAKNGKINGLIISEGVLTDLIKGYSVIPISNKMDFEKENIIIDNNQFQEAILYQQGGLKKMFGIEQEN